MRITLFLFVLFLFVNHSNAQNLKNNVNSLKKVNDNSSSVIYRTVNTTILGKLEILNKDLGIMIWEDAKSKCEELGFGWRLPTKEELYFLFTNKKLIGNFASNSYWSSSEYDKGYAYSQSFYSGSQDNGDNYSKKDFLFVRAVRDLFYKGSGDLDLLGTFFSSSIKLNTFFIDEFEVILPKYSFSGSWFDAKELCKKLGSDWRLPTKNELIKIYNSTKSYEYFSNGFKGGEQIYWSNEDNGDYRAYGIYCVSGQFFEVTKTYTQLYLPIRLNKFINKKDEQQSLEFIKKKEDDYLKELESKLKIENKLVNVVEKKTENKEENKVIITIDKIKCYNLNGNDFINELNYLKDEKGLDYNWKIPNLNQAEQINNIAKNNKNLKKTLSADKNFWYSKDGFTIEENNNFYIFILNNKSIQDGSLKYLNKLVGSSFNHQGSSSVRVCFVNTAL